MKNSLVLLLLLLLSSALFSARVLADEEQQWLCGAERTTGFAFRGGDWQSVNFLPDNAMFTYDGSKGIVEFSESIFVLDCEVSEAHLLCNDGTQNFIIDQETGRAGFSSLQGALIQSNAYVSLFQCTRQ